MMFSTSSLYPLLTSRRPISAKAKQGFGTASSVGIPPVTLPVPSTRDTSTASVPQCPPSSSASVRERCPLSFIATVPFASFARWATVSVSGHVLLRSVARMRAVHAWVLVTLIQMEWLRNPNRSRFEYSSPGLFARATSSDLPKNSLEITYVP